MSRAAVRQQFFGHQAVDPAAMKHRRGGEDPADEKPSRLLQMRDDYQQRLLRQKEEKMVNMYEDNQRKNEERVERMTKGRNGGAYPNSKLRQPGHMQAQHLQQEERHHPSPGQMSSSPSVRDFFRERRELEAKGEYVPPIDQHYKQSKSRSSSGYSFHKSSAGVDRSQPLAPIHNTRRSNPSSPFPQNQPPPFSNKARLVKRVANSDRDVDENSNYKQPKSQRGPPKKPAAQARDPASKSVKPSPASTPKDNKMSDFQKWQMEQSKAREERVRKSNKRGPQQSGDWEGDDGEDGGETPQSRQERELLEKIAKQQADLDRMKREREEEEERERQEAAERERRRQQRQQQQQQEARRRREEEAQARRQEEEEAARKRAARAKQDRYEEVTDEAVSGSTTHRGNNSNRRGVQPTPRKPPPQQRRQPPPQRRPPTEDEEDLELVPGPGNEIYSQAMDGETGGKVKLVPCKLCGRKFADDRVKKHQDACKKAQKKRKVFDPSQMRTEGTEMAKYVDKRGNSKKEPPKKKKADWRQQHEEFIANIRYAKQVQQMEQQGVAAKDLPPPPPSHNPDLVPCPHCGRTFNELAAERHIPRCKDLNTRPAAKRR